MRPARLVRRGSRVNDLPDLPQQGDAELDVVERPRVVCLCGASRFRALMESERQRLTARGVIVLGP